MLLLDYSYARETRDTILDFFSFLNLWAANLFGLSFDTCPWLHNNARILTSFEDSRVKTKTCGLSIRCFVVLCVSFRCYKSSRDWGHTISSVMCEEVSLPSSSQLPKIPSWYYKVKSYLLQSPLHNWTYENKGHNTPKKRLRWRLCNGGLLKHQKNKKDQQATTTTTIIRPFKTQGVILRDMSVVFEKKWHNCAMIIVSLNSKPIRINGQ